MLILKCPGTGLAWRQRGAVVGKRARRDVLADHTLCEEDFE